MKFRIIKRNNTYMPQSKFLFWWHNLFTTNMNFRTIDDARTALFRHRDFPEKYNTESDKVVYEVEITRDKIMEGYL